ncbi:response regulator transcription factor [Pedobacter sp. GSP4]|uniref:response regulator transcription factor n=1 Tax=Pedobacter sp. GSP4 TaxID=3453716 RepID=UPI003EE8FFA2
MGKLGGRKRICVLEDDNDIREIIEFLLRSEHYQVCSYATIASFMSEAPGKYADAFVLDVMLPDGSGMEVCRMLKENTETRSVPVLMMSANYTAVQVAEHCGAQDFIKKPFDIDDFVHRIETQLMLNNNSPGAF